MTEAAAVLRLRAHAKINLALDVVGIRPDGYHLLRTTFQALALHDDLTFERCPGAFSLSCSDPLVPADRRNLVWKAAELVWTATGRRGEPVGVRVHIEKRIPAQGGLGGGSSDGAAALVAFDALFARDAGTPLEELARRLGADVPFFLHGGTALGVGRGDEIEAMPDLPVHDVVLVFPRFGVSTPEAFRWYDEDAPSSLPARDAGPLPWGFNALQAPVCRRHPEIGRACRELERAGAETAAMTGSGSTVFGLFPPGSGEAGADRLRADGWRVLVTATAGRDATQPRP